MMTTATFSMIFWTTTWNLWTWKHSISARSKRTRKWKGEWASNSRMTQKTKECNPYSRSETRWILDKISQWVKVQVLNVNIKLCINCNSRSIFRITWTKEILQICSENHAIRDKLNYKRTGNRLKIPAKEKRLTLKHSNLSWNFYRRRTVGCEMKMTVCVKEFMLGRISHRLMVS